MTRLLKFGSPVESMFQLMGDDEDALTAALGYSLAVSPVLLRLLLSDVLQEVPATLDDTTIAWQTRHDLGITDLEIDVPRSAFIVIEAKKGAALPSLHQLQRYARICSTRREPQVLLVPLTSATREEANLSRAALRIAGVPVAPLSWRRIRTLAQLARERERHRARSVLRQLLVFLEDFLGLETIHSNMVFVVSLGSDNPPRWRLSWIDIVEKHRKYFYGVGAPRWPPPPNYMGFRYRGRLQSVHHVESWRVVPDLRKEFRGAEHGPAWGPHYLLDLGPAIRPNQEVLSGPRVLRNNRVWCMLDTLLTSRTISEALTITRARERRADSLSA